MSLKIEIDTDPLGRGYSDMTNQQIVDSLNTEDRSRNRDSMSGEEIFQTTDITELNALSASNIQLWVSFTRADFVDPFATVNVGLAMKIFGGGSATITALSAARTENISRAVEIGIRSPVHLNHVIAARS